MASETAGKTTSLLLKLYCGTGHIMNDVFRQIALSFVLIFMIKVAGLSGKEAGFILLLSQIVHGLVGPLMGYCSDKVVLPLIGRCLGRRKAWHLIGTIFMAILIPLMFTRCFICHYTSARWWRVAYYAVIFVFLNVAYPTIDIGHLSIISVVAKNQEECVSIHTLR